MCIESPAVVFKNKFSFWDDSFWNSSVGYYHNGQNIKNKFEFQRQLWIIATSYLIVQCSRWQEEQ